nr:MAG TPA: hypothetical protein [Bacteriophage sp.]
MAKKLILSSDLLKSIVENSDRVPCKTIKGSPFLSTTLEAFSGSFYQSPNHSLKALVLT